MKITILSLFPEMFGDTFNHSIIKIAREKKLVKLNVVDIRDFGLTKHKTVDGTPFGGGIGMLLRVDVLHNALLSVINKQERTHTVLLDARGTKYDQEKAQSLSQYDHLILICGHYEGVDERIRKYIDEEISIGDFILTGGEIPAMMIVDSVTRLLKGVLKDGATSSESFSLIDEYHNLSLEFPQYTQPREYKGDTVPEVLTSGNHQRISEWRKKKSEEITKLHRPDLIKND